MAWLTRLLGGRRAQETPEDEPLARLLDEWLSQGLTQVNYPWVSLITKVPAWERVQALEREERARLAVLAARKLRASEREDRRRRRAMASAITATLKVALPFDAAQLVEVVDSVYLMRGIPERSDLTFPVKAVERLLGEEEAPGPELAEALARLEERVEGWSSRDTRDVVRRIEALLFRREEVDPESGARPLRLEPGEAWSDAARRDYEQAPPELKRGWYALLEHAETASAGRPSKKWLAAAGGLVDDLGPEVFAEAVARWFPLVDRPRSVALDPARWGPDPNLMITDYHMDVLKGLAWCASLREDAEVARALTALAITCNKKVPGIGPRAVRVANAAVWALGAMPGRFAVGQLAVVKVRVKTRTAQKGIDKALAAAAEREGVSRAEIEEMAVPAYGLDEVGLRTEQLGDFRAQLVVTGTSGVELRWLKPDGKRQKSVPAAVKRDHADALKDLKAAKKDIERMLSAQKDRLDGLFLRREPWTLATWRERYLDHPLVGALARRLIWRVGEVAACWHEGALRDLDGAPVEPTEDAQIRLWHPIGQATDQVLAWRSWLQERGIVQPFKQAWREIYLLTPAEEGTRTYSNRFAAHILRQHATSALAARRGWAYTLMLMVDDSFPVPWRALPEWGLRVEFWVDGAGDEYGTDTNETGVYLYVATDQVRFYPLDGSVVGSSHYGAPWLREGVEPVPLAQVPALVFSELMRDVDLFVGVCSVGNDPDWQDGGRRPEWGTYWGSYAFGELSETARTRREVLAGLLPKLAIADRARVEGRFVVVEGRLASYRIHIGSGNIQILPDNRYLCIVPGRGTAGSGRVMLPFEGDRILSIVLSKVFLLAADDRISDASILSQISRRA